MRKRAEYSFTMYISYLEIYDNQGYDLLHDTGRSERKLDDLPTVKIRENKNKQFILDGLGKHKIEKEEDAMVLLMIGDDNRMVAETIKNDSSTRSHCIFIIQLEFKKEGEDFTTVSKMHLVDLSGSERIMESKDHGQLFHEATSINLSLHFLEQVIVSLNRKAKGSNETHIPYRNSMMTMVLRDSLGGNCKTRMIATASGDADDIMESISTCKFANRVSLIKNSAIKNEIEDQAVIIQKQKQEINILKSELAMAMGKDQKTALDMDDITYCKKMVQEYLDDENNKIILKDMLMIQECFSQMRANIKELEEKIKNNQSQVVISGSEKNGSTGVGNDSKLIKRVGELEFVNKKMNEEIKRLNDLLKQKNEEDFYLLELVEKKKNREKMLAQNQSNNMVNNNYVQDSTVNSSFDRKKLQTRLEEEDK